MSGFDGTVIDYLTIRRALGHNLDDAARLLPRFVDWMDSRGHQVVTVALALEWSTIPVIEHGSTVHARRMTALRGFSKYLHGINPVCEIPPVGLIPNQKHRVVPYLFSAAEISALMTAATTLPTPLRAATYETMFGLLAVTGMRIGEAIRLDRDDINWQAALVVVRKSKFGKSRELAVQPSTLDALAAYLDVRDRHCPQSASPAVFVSRTGNRIEYANACTVFSALRDIAGLRPRSPSCRPTIHSLRHSFAVNTLTDWYSQDLDIGPRLAWLSTYLGHFGPVSTYWYLTASPELMSLAARRLEHALMVPS